MASASLTGHEVRVTDIRAHWAGGRPVVAYVISEVPKARHDTVVRGLVRSLHTAWNGVEAERSEIESSRRTAVEVREPSRDAVEHVLEESRKCFGRGQCRIYVRIVPPEWVKA